MNPTNFDAIPEKDIKFSGFLQNELQRLSSGPLFKKLETKLYLVEKPDPALENDVQVKVLILSYFCYD
jgi:hypothetical protein